MKKLMLSTIIIFATISLTFANPNNAESQAGANEFSNNYLSYNVTKDGSTVVLHLDIINLSEYEVVEVLRSDNPNDGFRRVKYLSGDNLNGLTTNPKVVDKYPLSSKSESYYRVSTTDKNGVVKFFPSVQLIK